MEPSWAVFDTTTGRVAGTPLPSNVGTFSNIVISGSDGTATTHLAPFAITVLPLPNNPPRISGTPATTVVAGHAYSFQPSATDPNGLAIKFGITGKPAWAVFDSNTGRLWGTPAAADAGTYANIVITAHDGYMKGVLPAFSIVVQIPPPVPTTVSATLSWVPPVENTDGSDMSAIVARMRDIVAATPLPVGYRTSLEGSFREGEQGRLMMALLTPISILLIYLVLNQRFRSVILSLIIMGNIPLALVGSVAALWLTGQDLDLSAMIGFIAVTGIAVRNSLLKVSHFINLHLHEKMPLDRRLILRGSGERLTPVLMTALAAGLGLAPLLISSDVAGTEILHPVAVSIFGGLISSTLLDTFTTPVLFERFGRRALSHVIEGDAALAYETF